MEKHPRKSCLQPSKKWAYLAFGLLLIAGFIYCFAQFEARYTLMRRLKTAEAGLRALTQVMEAYSIDWSCPPLATDARPGYKGVRYSWDEEHEFSTYRIDNLTTPIGYFKSHPKDPFSLTGRNDYCYFFSHSPWGDVLWSPGPDRVYDLNPYVVPDLLTTRNGRVTDLYHHYTYDPTNGAVSAGDIWSQVINHWDDPPKIQGLKWFPLREEISVDLRENSMRLAAGRGDLDAVRKWVEDGVNINAPDLGGRTALHYAARWDRIEIVSYLIERGAEVSQRDGDGDTPLHLASLWSSKDLIELLVKNGANVNAAGSLGETPIFCALDKKREDVALLLVQQDIDVNTTVTAKYIAGLGYGEPGDFTAIYVAAGLGYWETVNLLAEKGADVNAGPYSSAGPLHFAIKANQPETVKLLVEKGATIWNHFHIDQAAKNGDVRVFQALLDHCPGENATYSERTRALSDKRSMIDQAVREGYPAVVEALVGNGVDVGVRYSRGWTLLHHACSPELHGDETMQGQQGTQLAIVKALLQAKPLINAQASDGETPLDLASKNNLNEIAELLRSNGAKTNAELSGER